MHHGLRPIGIGGRPGRLRKPFGKLAGLWWYPGWALSVPDHRFGPPWTTPWALLANFPERCPPGGPRDERLQTVVDDKMRQCINGGVDFVAFNYYYKGALRQPFLGHAIANFMSSTVQGLKFCAAFECETPPVLPITSQADWFHLCDNVFAPMFSNPKYLRVNGRPVWMNIKMEYFHDNMTAASGRTHAQMISDLRTRTGQNVYAVACATPLNHWMNIAATSGYDAFSQYNLFVRQLNDDGGSPGPSPINGSDLIANYAFEWVRQAARCAAFGLQFLLPWTAGWDHTPWDPPEGPFDRIEAIKPSPLQTHILSARLASELIPHCIGMLGYALDERGEGAWMEADAVSGNQKMLIHRGITRGA